MKKITIAQDVYDKLVERSVWLRWLEIAGVDNWDGYEIAQELREEAET